MLSIRPEDLHVLTAEAAPGAGIPASVTFIRDLGSQVEILLVHEGHELIATMAPKDRPAVSLGDDVMLDLPAAACRVVPA